MVETGDGNTADVVVVQRAGRRETKKRQKKTENKEKLLQ